MANSSTPVGSTSRGNRVPKQEANGEFKGADVKREHSVNEGRVSRRRRRVKQGTQMSLVARKLNTENGKVERSGSRGRRKHVRIFDSNINQLIKVVRGKDGKVQYEVGRALKEASWVEVSITKKSDLAKFISAIIHLHKTGENKISELDINHARALTDKDLGGILLVCPNLKRIDILHTSITGTVIEFFVQKGITFNKLEDLALISCPRLNDRGVAALLKVFPNLKRLEIYDSAIECAALGFWLQVHGVEHLNLRRLSFVKCRDLTYEALVSLLSISKEHLEYLSLSETELWGGDFVKLLKQSEMKLKRLKQLDLFWSKGLGVLQLIALMQKIENLERFKVKASPGQLLVKPKADLKNGEESSEETW